MDEALLSALAAAEAGDLAESARICADVIAEQPTHRDAWGVLRELAREGLAGEACFEVARALESAEALEDAVGWWGRGVEGAPDAALGWRGLGLALLRVDRYRAAARALQQAAERLPDDPEPLLLRGLALEADGQYPAARRAYLEADYLDPLDLDVALRLAGVSLRLRRYRDALAALLHAAALAPDAPELQQRLRDLSQRHRRLVPAAEALHAQRDADANRWCNAALRAEGRGDRGQAIWALEKALQGDPDHPTARHLHAAYTGAAVDGPPPGYVAGLFDQYADHFESHLVEELGYQLPGALAALARRDGVSLRRVLDLGCGTGLLGPHVRPPAERLVGVDLSERMLSLARGVGLYDALLQVDATTHLQTTAETYDAIFAAEVFIYVGALDALLPAAAARLSPEGSLLVSLESLSGSGFRLRDNGRFAHSRAYLDEQAARAGLAVAHREWVPIRRSGEGWEEGEIVRLQKS